MHARLWKGMRRVTEEMLLRILRQLRKAAQTSARMAMSCSGSACAHLPSAATA